MASYALPNWLLKALGEPKAPFRIWHDTKRYIVSSPDNQVEDQFYETIEEAYDAIENDAGVIFDQSCPQPRTPGGALIISHQRLRRDRYDGSSMESLEDDLFQFLDQELSKFLASPTDFMACYNFLSNHPGFWVRKDAKAPIHKQNWQTSDYISEHASIFPTEKANGPHQMVIEFGCHSPTEYVFHNYDERMVLERDSYEEMIIAAAEQLHKLVYPLGMDREELLEPDYELIMQKLKRLHEKNLTHRELAGKPLA